MYPQWADRDPPTDLVIGTKDPSDASSLPGYSGAMTDSAPARLAGDELSVPCLDGVRRRYLSFDAAAATGALPGVLDAVQAFVPWYASVQGGAGYKSQASAVGYEGARLATLAFAGRCTAADDAVLFCRNATEAIDRLGRLLRLRRDDVVVTTVAEHQANLRPWARAASGRHVQCGMDGTFGTEDVVALLGGRPRPALLAITGASGVTGWLPPLADIIEAAHRRGVPVLADVAQLAPHDRLPAHADFLVWSGPKMYAPFGAGVLIGPRRVLRADAALAYPADPEADGSPNVLGAVALHAAMETLSGTGWPVITAHERHIAAMMRRGLAAIPQVHLLGPAGQGADSQTLPLATFVVTGIPHGLVAARLAAEHAIGVGHGRFGAGRYLDRLLGTTAERGENRREIRGAIRASAGISTTRDDVRRLLAAVASVVADVPPVPYHQDPSTGDFFPAAGVPAELQLNSVIGGA